MCFRVRKLAKEPVDENLQSLYYKILHIIDNVLIDSSEKPSLSGQLCTPANLHETINKLQPSFHGVILNTT